MNLKINNNSLFRLSKVIGQSSLKGVSFYVNEAFSLFHYPTFILWEVNNRCNAKCAMCGIWSAKDKTELSLGVINNSLDAILFKNIGFVNLTGGEPFLRSDLPELIDIFVNKLSTLRAIQISTNGILTERIYEDVKRILSILNPSQGLSITVSIDGPEVVHDRMRGITGAHKKAITTLKYLESIEDPRLDVGVSTTISPANLSNLKEIIGHVESLSANIGIYPAISSEGFYHNDDMSDVAFTPEDAILLADFFKTRSYKSLSQSYYFYQLFRFFRCGKRKFPCLMGRKSFYIDHKGDVYPCPLLSVDYKTLYGNIANQEASNAWFDATGRDIVKDINSQNPVCRECTLLCDLISLFREEFFHFASYYALHPVKSIRMLREVNSLKNKNLI